MARTSTLLKRLQPMLATFTDAHPQILRNETAVANERV